MLNLKKVCEELNKEFTNRQNAYVSLFSACSCRTNRNPDTSVWHTHGCSAMTTWGAEKCRQEGRYQNETDKFIQDLEWMILRYREAISFLRSVTKVKIAQERSTSCNTQVFNYTGNTVYVAKISIKRPQKVIKKLRDTAPAAADIILTDDQRSFLQSLNINVDANQVSEQPMGEIPLVEELPLEMAVACA